MKRYENISFLTKVKNYSATLGIPGTMAFKFLKMFYLTILPENGCRFSNSP